MTTETAPKGNDEYNRVPRPGILWNGVYGDQLPENGGKTRNGKTLASAEQPKVIAHQTVAKAIPSAIPSALAPTIAISIQIRSKGRPQF